jgi:hypothetical protein
LRSAGCWDSCGAYEQAFNAYQAANRASRESAGPAAQYDRQRQERLVDALIAAFPQVRDAAATPAGGVKPIFVCGMFRSGSTLTEQVLAAHRRVVAGGEIDFIPLLVRTELAPYPASMTQVTADVLANMAGRYVQALSTLYPGAEYVTDKRPDNFLNIGLIKTLFPDARIVHTTRNPLDNCLSIYFLHLDHGMNLRARSARHRPLLPAIPPADGSLAGALRAGHPRFRLRRVRARPPAPPSSACSRSAAWSRMRTA